MVQDSPLLAAIQPRTCGKLCSLPSVRVCALVWVGMAGDFWGCWRGGNAV